MFSWDKIQDAHKEMEGNKNSGKVSSSYQSAPGSQLIVRSYLKSPSNRRRALGRGPSHVLGRIRNVEPDIDMHPYCLRATYSELSLPYLNDNSGKKGLNSLARSVIRAGEGSRNAHHMVLYTVGMSTIGRLVVL